MTPYRTEYERSYAEAFDAFVESSDERALAAAYELGRAAVGEKLSVLDLAELHQRVLTAALPDAADAGALAAASGDFFLEALAAFEMVRRALEEAVETAAIERRHATVLRRLSHFLSDTSIAFDAAGSLDEVCHLVAEHAREITGAASAVARLTEPAACVAEVGEPLDAPALTQPLTALDGRRLGEVAVAGKPGGFTTIDDAMLVQLAQMATAAIERAQLYSR
jgi:phosphoserine phosphatase RsbU-like protein